MSTQALKPGRDGVVRTPVQKVTVDAQSDGQRIDNFLIKQLKSLNRNQVYQLLRKGEVRVNGARAKPSLKLSLDDIVRIPPVAVTPQSLMGENTAPKKMTANLLAQVAFEDDDFVVLNKPAGLPSHGGSGHEWGAIEVIRQARDDFSTLQLAHRLDSATSGLLLLAKTLDALRSVHDVLRDHQCDKRYLALVEGKPRKKAWTIKTEMENQRGDKPYKKPENQTAISHFKVLAAHQSCTLLEVKIDTGRMHQIRRHCADQGLPIIGDDKYGDRGVNKYYAKQGHKGMFLHAYQLAFKLENKAVSWQVLPGERWQPWMPLP